MNGVILFLAAVLAFANGGNDNGKGVASLIAHGQTRPGTALGWAAVTTAAGALLAAFWSGGLVRSFRAGFLAADQPEASFYAAVLAGSLAWVLLAIRMGLPVSTTHALVGGLVGAGVLTFGLHGIDWGAVGVTFALPLAAGPLLSLGLTAASSRPLARLAGTAEERCACLMEEPVPRGASGEIAEAGIARSVRMGHRADCKFRNPTVEVTGGAMLRGAHWGTAGLVGLARGWNDTPKIAALALVALPAGASGTVFALVTGAMALGGLVAGRRVLHTLGERITHLPLGESVAASGGSALLVGLASFQGLPVSTTHVTTGALVGAGISRRRSGIRWATVREIVLAWVVTLPAAALIAVVCAWLIR